MAATMIFPGVHQLTISPVNVFLIEDGAKLTLVDCGFPGSTEQILDAVRALGKQPKDVTNILITHAHPDHFGSAASLKQATGAALWCHPADATYIRGKTPIPPATPAPFWLNRLLFRRFKVGTPHAGLEYCDVDKRLQDSATLPIAGGIRVVFTPGHSPGHCALLLKRDGGLLFAADACSNMPFLQHSIAYDDFPMAQKSLQKLIKEDFSAVCFGHGKAIAKGAADRMRRKFKYG